MNENKIKAGVIGLGLIGPCHIEAIRRTGFADVKACADLDTQLANKKAQQDSIPLVYNNIDEMIADPDIMVIHNCTPNYLHKEINGKVIRSGKHLFSEKPLARSASESQVLLDLLNDFPQTVAAVNFNYRMNPLVQEMRVNIANGEIGKPRIIHGSYLQDWLMKDTDYSWRLDKKISGESNTIADIGSHWMDLVQHLVNEKITEVFANLVTNIPVRKKPKGQVEAFAKNVDQEFDEVKIDVEDFGSVMFKMSGGAQGVFYVSQVSAGRKCFFNVEINGEKASYYWNQETADHMWAGYQDEPNRQIFRDPNRMTDDIRKYAFMPAGHPEGWKDAMANNVKDFYSFIKDKKNHREHPCNFATFGEAHYVLKLVEAILESHKSRQWVSIN